MFIPQSLPIKPDEEDLKLLHHDNPHLCWLLLMAATGESPIWGEDRVRAHMRRVGRLASRLALDMGLDEEFCATLEFAAQLHDLGLAAVGTDYQAGWYHTDSFTRHYVAQHCTQGSRWLEMVSDNYHACPIMDMASLVALHHHEAWNGSGYPKGLRKGRISLEGRLVAIADFYDSCVNLPTESEPNGIDPDEAAEMVLMAGGQYFDPMLARLFAKHHRRYLE